VAPFSTAGGTPGDRTGSVRASACAAFQTVRAKARAGSPPFCDRRRQLMTNVSTVRQRGSRVPSRRALMVSAGKVLPSSAAAVLRSLGRGEPADTCSARS
jgi:hypothetical protein